ncbi:unnamed protein product [Amoebophrya sp. A25]|nr:unnamed protein product [Amoebophrya sp. A25]|eukprot:GSA25T00001077001.1
MAVQTTQDNQEGTPVEAVLHFVPPTRMRNATQHVDSLPVGINGGLAERDYGQSSDVDDASHVARVSFNSTASSTATPPLVVLAKTLLTTETESPTRASGDSRANGERPLPFYDDANKSKTAATSRVAGPSVGQTQNTRKNNDVDKAKQVHMETGNATNRMQKAVKKVADVQAFHATLSNKTPAKTTDPTTGKSTSGSGSSIIDGVQDKHKQGAEENNDQIVQKLDSIPISPVVDLSMRHAASSPAEVVEDGWVVLDLPSVDEAEESHRMAAEDCDVGRPSLFEQVEGKLGLHIAEHALDHVEGMNHRMKKNESATTPRSSSRSSANQNLNKGSLKHRLVRRSPSSPREDRNSLKSTLRYLQKKNAGLPASPKGAGHSPRAPVVSPLKLALEQADTSKAKRSGSEKGLFREDLHAFGIEETPKFGATTGQEQLPLPRELNESKLHSHTAALLLSGCEEHYDLETYGHKPSHSAQKNVEENVASTTKTDLISTAPRISESLLAGSPGDRECAFADEEASVLGEFLGAKNASCASTQKVVTCVKKDKQDKTENSTNPPFTQKPGQLLRSPLLYQPIALQSPATYLKNSLAAAATKTIATSASKLSKNMSTTSTTRSSTAGVGASIRSTISCVASVSISSTKVHHKDGAGVPKQSNPRLQIQQPLPSFQSQASGLSLPLRVSARSPRSTSLTKDHGLRFRQTLEFPRFANMLDGNETVPGLNNGSKSPAMTSTNTVPNKSRNMSTSSKIITVGGSKYGPVAHEPAKQHNLVLPQRRVAELLSPRVGESVAASLTSFKTAPTATSTSKHNSNTSKNYLNVATCPRRQGDYPDKENSVAVAASTEEINYLRELCEETENLIGHIVERELSSVRNAGSRTSASTSIFSLQHSYSTGIYAAPKTRRISIHDG